METSKIILDDVIKDIAAGPFGSNLKVSCFVESGFPIIDGANLKGYKVTDNVTKFVTEEKANSLSRSIAHRHDVVVTISGTLGQIAYIPDDSEYEAYLCSQRQFRITFDEGKVYVPFLVFYFHTHEGQQKILSFANQTGVPALSQPLKNFRQIEFDLPTLNVQKKIAGIIELINEKIELNEEVNNNLLQQVTAIFHKYFDEYDVINTSNIALGDIANFKYGTMPKKEKLGTGTHIAFSGYQVVGAYPEQMFEEPQLIIVARGVGGCGDVKYTPPDCYLTNLSIAIITENAFYDDYLYHYLRLQDTTIMNTGSAQPQITVSTLEKFRISLPPEEKLIAFSGLINPFKVMFRENTKVIQQLSLLRDELLPKLMSGQLDVSRLDL